MEDEGEKKTERKHSEKGEEKREVASIEHSITTAEKKTPTTSERGKERLEIVFIEDRRIGFRAHGVSHTKWNSVKRVIESLVETLAIEKTIFMETTNMEDCVITEQVLATALGLLPIESKVVEGMRRRTECDCEDYCERCSRVYELKVENVSTREPMDVTSLSLHQVGGTDAPIVQDPKRPGKGVILTIIGPGKRIHLRAIARKNYGRFHPRYNPMISFILRSTPTLKMDSKAVAKLLPPDLIRKIHSSCPAKVFDIEDSGSSLLLTAPRLAACTRCMLCANWANRHTPDGGNTRLIEVGRVIDSHYIEIEVFLLVAQSSPSPLCNLSFL